MALIMQKSSSRYFHVILGILSFGCVLALSDSTYASSSLTPLLDDEASGKGKKKTVKLSILPDHRLVGIKPPKVPTANLRDIPAYLTVLTEEPQRQCLATIAELKSLNASLFYPLAFVKRENVIKTHIKTLHSERLKQQASSGSGYFSWLEPLDITPAEIKEVTKQFPDYRSSISHEERQLRIRKAVTFKHFLDARGGGRKAVHTKDYSPSCQNASDVFAATQLLLHSPKAENGESYSDQWLFDQVIQEMQNLNQESFGQTQGVQKLDCHNKAAYVLHYYNKAANFFEQKRLLKVIQFFQNHYLEIKKCSMEGLYGQYQQAIQESIDLDMYLTQNKLDKFLHVIQFFDAQSCMPDTLSEWVQLTKATLQDPILGENDFTRRSASISNYLLGITPEFIDECLKGEAPQRLIVSVQTMLLVLAQLNGKNIKDMPEEERRNYGGQLLKDFFEQEPNVLQTLEQTGLLPEEPFTRIFMQTRQKIEDHLRIGEEIKRVAETAKDSESVLPEAEVITHTHVTLKNNIDGEVRSS